MKNVESKRELEPNTIGLCAECQHLRLIKSDRGSTFYLCQRSLSDSTFPKYPRLPVIECRGFELLAGDPCDEHHREP